MKPQTIWNPSPNYSVLPGRKVSLIVIHATGTAHLASPLACLCDPNAKDAQGNPDRRSAHYLIDTNGDIYHLVLDEHVAWHAGVSKWKGMEFLGKSGLPSVNRCSVGIELVNLNDGKMVYPPEQKAAAARLVKYLKDEHGVSSDNVVGHLDVAPGRKDDPRGFDLAGFRKTVEAL